MWSCSRDRAVDPPRSSSLADEKRVCSLLLRTPERHLPTLAANASSVAKGSRHLLKTPTQTGQVANSGVAAVGTVDIDTKTDS